MATNQRHILLQRAIRAERAEAIANAQTNALRAELASLRDYVAKLQVAAMLAADLSPATQTPPAGAQVQLLRVRDAVHDGTAWKCPYTEQRLEPTLGTYWRLPEGAENDGR